MDKAKFDIEVRLMALEYCAASALSKIQLIAIAQGATEAQVQEASDRGQETLNRVTIPGIDPTMSDHFTAELRDAIMDIIRSANEMRAGLLSGQRN